MDAILILTKCTPGVYMASAKIAQFLSEKLQIPIIDREGHVDDYDNIFFVNSMSPYCLFMDEVVEIVKRCKRVVWIMNDYDIYPPTQVRNYLYENPKEVLLWSTVPRLSDQLAARKTYGNLPQIATAYVNWNMLTYEPRELVEPTKKGIVYYGAYRKYREKLFEKYFELANYFITISGSKRAIEKFEDIDPVIDTGSICTDLIGWLQQFPATIYLEDSKSNNMYCSPANRFYECLAAGIAILFDKSSMWTMEQAGFDIRPYVVQNKDDLECALNHWDEIRKEQAENWRQDYRWMLNEQVERAYSDLNN